MSDARLCGLSPSALQNGSRAGRWVGVRRGVYRMAGAPHTWRQDVMAAQLACGPRGLISHMTAVHLWQLDPRRPDGLHVSGPVKFAVPRVISHRVLDLLPMDHDRRFGIPVTTVDRTLIDVAGLVDQRKLVRLTDRALRRNLISIRRLAYRFDLLERRGRPGIAKLREVIADRRRSADALESDAEVEFREIVRLYGLPEPVPQHWLETEDRRRRLDFAYIDRMIAIEIDGPHHDEFGQLEDDRERQNAITNAGWRMYRFSPRMLRREPHSVATTLGAALGLEVPGPRRRVRVRSG